jgi:hypothetical protein
MCGGRSYRLSLPIRQRFPKTVVGSPIVTIDLQVGPRHAPSLTKSTQIGWPGFPCLHRCPHLAVAGRAEGEAAGDYFMSAFSVSRFYAAGDVDSAFSQNIESLFNRFIALQACRTGWHVDLQNSSPDAHRATITDPEGIAKRSAILNGAKSDFSDHLRRQYWEYAARNPITGEDSRQTKWQIRGSKGDGDRLQRWRQLVRASLRPSGASRLPWLPKLFR